MYIENNTIAYFSMDNNTILNLFVNSGGKNLNINNGSFNRKTDFSYANFNAPKTVT